MQSANIFQLTANKIITVYAMAHPSVFPLLLSKNLTTFASGFTASAFFSFYLTHLLQEKQCIAGPKFKTEQSDEERIHYESMLRGKGYILRYSHIGTTVSFRSNDQPMLRVTGGVH